MIDWAAGSHEGSRTWKQAMIEICQRTMNKLTIRHVAPSRADPPRAFRAAPSIAWVAGRIAEHPARVW